MLISISYIEAFTHKTLFSSTLRKMPVVKAKSNWSKLKQKIVVDDSKAEGHKKRKRTDIEDFLRSKTAPESKKGISSDILDTVDECMNENLIVMQS